MQKSWHGAQACRIIQVATCQSHFSRERTMKKAIVIFSGGPDSTAAALWSIAQGYETELLTFLFKDKSQYGELKASIKIADSLSLKQTLFDFKSSMGAFEPNAHILMHAGTEVVGVDKSLDHRLPLGAAMILTTACNYAVYNGIHTVVWGATKSDSQSGNYEYTQDFCDDLASVLSKVVTSKINIIAPFSNMRKYEIIKEYYSAKEALFANTWSCKSGGSVQSGDCHASRARRVAARMAGVPDNTEYLRPLNDWIFTDAEFSNPGSIEPRRFDPEGSEPAPVPW
jgi:7-cyano-7-deazaguanine synthase in queuosine biosynthesis